MNENTSFYFASAKVHHSNLFYLFFFYFFLIFNIILYLEKQFLKKTLENTR